MFQPKNKPITSIHFMPKFCSQCGGMLEEKFVPHENCERLQCPQCEFIAYLNPFVVAGAIVSDGNGKIILLKRGIEPAKSTWTYPAGFVELGESVEQAAIRETKEEVGVDISLGEVLGVYSYPDAAVATVVYLARLVGGTPQTTKEAEAVDKFTAETVPWKELSFKSTHDALKDWANSLKE